MRSETSRGFKHLTLHRLSTTPDLILREREQRCSHDWSRGFSFQLQLLLQQQFSTILLHININNIQILTLHLTKHYTPGKLARGSRWLCTQKL